jgi:hypothetical protein
MYIIQRTILANETMEFYLFFIILFLAWNLQNKIIIQHLNVETYHSMKLLYIIVIDQILEFKTYLNPQVSHPKILLNNKTFNFNIIFIQHFHFVGIFCGFHK